VGSEAARDGKRWDSLRARARRSLQARLMEVLPRYAEIRTLQHERLDALFDDVRPQPPVLEPVVPPAEPPSVFRAPFGVDRVGSFLQFDSMDILDRSFAEREFGHLLVDADLAAEASVTGPFIPGGIDFGSVSAACGSPYTIPQDGRLSLTASLQQFVGRGVTLQLHDKFGFSSGELSVNQTIFIAVLRPDGGEVREALVAEQTLTSDGDDVNGRLPDVDQRDFNVLASTNGSYAAGETVFVLAGTKVQAGSVLDDMKVHVRALLWWALVELTVSVVQ
jgi:hypothetical protein